MCQYPDIPISWYPDIPISRYPGIPISQYPDIPISRYPDIPISQYPDILISWYPDILTYWDNIRILGYWDIAWSISPYIRILGYWDIWLKVFRVNLIPPTMDTHMHLHVDVCVTVWGSFLCLSPWRTCVTLPFAQSFVIWCFSGLFWKPAFGQLLF